MGTYTKQLTDRERHNITDCPHCEDDEGLVVYKNDDGLPRYRVSCVYCGVSGPNLLSRSASIEEWNILMG